MHLLAICAINRGVINPFFARLFCITLVSLFAACSSQPQLSPLAPDATILAFGDSLTHGSGVSREQSYPTVLARLTGLKVVNAGLPGEVSEAGLKRLPEVLEEVRPDLLILCHGGNDMLRKLGMTAAAKHLRSMIRLAQQQGIPVILVAVPRPGVFLSEPDFYQEVADEMNIPIEHDVLADVLSDRSLKSDMIHPNREGYRMMAEAVFDVMKESGAVE